MPKAKEIDYNGVRELALQGESRDTIAKFCGLSSPGFYARLKKDEALAEALAAGAGPRKNGRKPEPAAEPEPAEVPESEIEAARSRDLRDETDLLCVGDYVLATKYYDGDPQDHWCVGFYHSTLDYGEGRKRYQVVDGEGKQFRGNGFRRIKKISNKRGKWLLDNASQIESSGVSVWHWARKKMSDT